MSLKIFVCFEGTRELVDIRAGETVQSFKEKVQEIYHIDTKGSVEKKFVVANYYGSDLKDDWHLSDIDVSAGSTIRISLREEVKPKLFIRTAYNGEIVEITEDINFVNQNVKDLRSMVVRRTGIPVTVFRLMKPDDRSEEIFDCNSLYSYGIEQGKTVPMETWDGWNDFLKACIIGHTSEVLQYMSREDSVHKYQARVALYIAAHHGHLDLATTMLRMGVRPDEAVGCHPMREWCASDPSGEHIDSRKTPIHEASEHGQIQIIKIFVLHNVCCVTSKDGNGLTALNIALRKRQREVALYLLTKQWSNVSYSAVSLPLTIFAQVRKWCDKAKERVAMVYGPEKSSLRSKKVYRQGGALVGLAGPHVDGFSYSTQNSSSKTKSYERAKKKSIEKMFDIIYKNEQKAKAKELEEEEARRLAELTASAKRLPRISQEEKVPSLVAKYKEIVAAKKADGTFRRGRVRFPKSKGGGEGLKFPEIAAADKSRSGANDDNPAAAPGKRSAYLRTPLNEAAAAGAAVGATGASGGSDKKRRKKRTENSVISLPSVSLEAKERPFFYHRSEADNIPKNTIEFYEEMLGCSTRDKAIESLTVASTFREKPWLQQVRLAMCLSRMNIKRAIVKKPAAASERSPRAADKSAAAGKVAEAATGEQQAAAKEPSENGEFVDAENEVVAAS